MGDFKCNSGIKDNNQDSTIDKTNKVADTYSSNDNYNDPTNQVTDSYDPDMAGDKPKNYGKNNLSDNSDYTKNDSMDDSDCGCGTSGIADSTDTIDLPDDLADATVIYSETVYFDQPYDYDKQDSQPRTSDLVEDEQEGSEFITNDSSRPQC